MVLALTACGGGGDSGSSPPPATVKIGGTVTGLTGTGLVLRNNGADDLAIASDGAFTFATSLGTAVAYNVSVTTQPTNQTCAVTNATGTTAAANITNVTVTCAGIAVTAPSALSYPSPQTFPVGATITPLNPTVTGTVTTYSVLPALPAGLALNTTTGQITGTPTAASVAAIFVITAANSGGSTTFSLTIAVTAPAANFTIGGTVTGLTGTGLILRNNGADDLAVASDGAFTFSTSFGIGVAYNVSIATQPTNQTCVVANGTGTTAAANITNVTVTCAGIAVPAPSALSYPSPQSYAVDVAITPLNPTVTGTVTSYSVLPALPAGLALNTSTGQITGTPTAASAAANFVITAANSGGSTTFSLTITVITTGNFTIGGTVTGLKGTGLVLRNNGGNDLTGTASGAVTFSMPLASKTLYAVVVKTQPVLPGQICTVTNGAGTVGGANVTNVAIDCVGSSFTDTDRDGLTDEIEAMLGTDPTKVDSDGDTLGDGEEVLLRGSDPLKTDTEDDSVSDDSEVANGTNPHNFDTDGDLLDDGVDPYPWRADGDGDGLLDIDDLSPLLRDADGGGASDGAEFAAGTDPFAPGDDRPSIDSDHDFLTDNDELALGTDPFNPDTDGDRTLDGFEAGLCDPLIVDTDGDKLKDSVERAASLKCDQPDSDHDGLADSDEVGPSVPDQDVDGLIDGVEERVYHSFSGVQDTDNDGLKDGDEVKLHRTDPISADTDCDGTNDGLEVLNGTDPLHGPGGSTCSI